MDNLDAVLKFPCPIEPLIAHSAPMSLLDNVVSSTPESCTAELTITQDSRFVTSDGVPAWVGIEYMAQTIAAYAGIRAKLKNNPVKIGFLVGSRKYTANFPYFSVGQCLRVQVDSEMEQVGGLSVFNCQILNENEDVLAQAALNVFEPENVDEFMKENSL